MKSGQRGREQVCSFHVIFDHSAVLIFLMFYGLVVILFYVFLFYVRERSDSYFDSFELWVAGSFQQDFLAFPFLTYYYSYFYQEGKKDWNCTATPFVFVLLCLMFVFLLRSAKRRFLTLGVGLVGRGFWIGFSFLIPSCAFFLLPFLSLLVLI